MSGLELHFQGSGTVSIRYKTLFPKRELCCGFGTSSCGRIGIARVIRMKKREQRKGSRKAGRPLARVAVVTLATNLPGPAAAALLCKFGASVTKVEPPGGDALAKFCPAWYRALSFGQRVISLDLKNHDDFGRFEKLLLKTDLLLTASRPAALERLSLGWKRIHRKFPSLCQIALVGYAAPRDHVPGHDLTYLAGVGLLEPPAMPRTLLADLASAERLVSTGLALLLARERTGHGSYAEVPIAEVAEDFSQPLRYGVTSPDGMLGGGSPGYNVYRSSDGWIAVAALEPHFWENLQTKLGVKNANYGQLAARFLTRSSGDWERWAAERDLPIAAVCGPGFLKQLD
jgi:alpha-methylacyl-CoA racemase